MICGLLGEKLGHSYSPQIHSQFGNYSYKLFEIKPNQLQEFLQKSNFHGINVTIPYKKAVIPYCHTLTPQAQKIGAVNTIIRNKDGDLIGHNTDYYGFQAMIERSGLSFAGKKVLVLGSGGASNTVRTVSNELGADTIVISRNGENNYSNIHLHSDCAIIVNATPVGMYPNTGHSPIDLSLFPHLEGVLDLIYNPARTQLLLDAEARNLVAVNGLWMLIAQAKESAEWFTGTKIDRNIIPRIHQILKCQMENIILIGMPGSGKSTIGKLLASTLNKTFVDSDACIEDYSGLTIPELFQKHGEEEFRKIETTVLSQIGKNSGCVIATGGGCVARTENLSLLKQNGTVIWLQRKLEDLPTLGRPLSQKTPLQDMYITRKPLYEQFADLIVDNNQSPQQTVSTILQRINLGESI